jgi:hypothetical protein
MIGIFWVYKGTVFGKARAVSEGMEHVGIIDSPDNHADFWDSDKGYTSLFPDLRFREYMDVPRGRFVYSVEDHRAVVYMDRTLFSDAIKRQLRIFFRLEDDAVVWRTDLHYTTSGDEIDHLFD